MTPNLRLDQQLCFALYAASRAATGAYREALDAAGLTYPQYLVLLALWEDDGLSVGDLGQRLHLDSGTLSPLLSRLETVGVVTRSRTGGDGRRVLVHLTEKGDALRAEAERIQCALLANIDMTDEELVALRALARRFVSAAHAGTAQHDVHPQPTTGRTR